MFIRLPVLAAAIVLIVVFLVVPKVITVKVQEDPAAKQMLIEEIWGFLEDKESPLAPETELILQQKHWKLLIAISAIESQYCKRQLGFNCWGVGGDSAYRKYDSIRTAIVDANNLIEYWQQQGRWLTVEDMNCHYVQPCNANWENVVNKVLNQMDSYERRAGAISQ